MCCLWNLVKVEILVLIRTNYVCGKEGIFTKKSRLYLYHIAFTRNTVTEDNKIRQLKYLSLSTKGHSLSKKIILILAIQAKCVKPILTNNKLYGVDTKASNMDITEILPSKKLIIRC